MDLMELLPDYYNNNKTMQELQGLLTTEIDKVITRFNKSVDECFVWSASELVSRYERLHGIKVDANKSVETRRGKIKAKMAGTGTFTKAMLMNATKAFPGGACEVVEDNPNYKFRIKFNDFYRVPDEASINEIHVITDELKPAHLTYDHTFTYNWWGYDVIKAKTWGNAGTWQALRAYEEVQ
jgi:uncharacterized protein YmfQ (DUF2313 family)